MILTTEGVTEVIGVWLNVTVVLWLALPVRLHGHSADRHLPSGLTVPRRIIAVWYGVFPAHLFAYPATYTSGTYETAFSIAPARAWAAGFLLCCAVLFIARSVPATVVMVGLLVTWGVALAAATIDGASQSPAGFVGPLGTAALLSWGALQQARR